MLGTERICKVNDIQASRRSCARFCIPKTLALQGLRPSITKLVLASLFGGPQTAYGIARLITDARYEEAIAGGPARDWHTCSRESVVRHADALVKLGHIDRQINDKGQVTYRLKLQ